MAHRISDTDLRVKFLLEGQEAVEKTVEKQKKEIKDYTKQVEDLNAELKKMVKEGEAETEMYKKKAKELAQNNAALDKARQKLESLYRQQKLGTMNMAELSRHIKVLNNELKHTDPGSEKWKKLTRELKATRERFQELSDQAKATGGVLQSLSKIKAATVPVIAVVAVAVRSVSKAIGTIADFEQANANLATIIGKDVKEIKVLTDSARQLGATTEYTASQVTQLQTELAKLGFKESDILNMQKPVLQFATAVGADLSEAASLAGATLRMFGLSTSQTKDALGALATATTNSALDFRYLQSAMSTIGPVAKTFGFTLKDTTALLGTLANSGFDASTAATATRNILLNLADANGKLATALGGPVRTFPELIDGLRKLNARGVDLTATLELTDRRSVSAFNTFLQGADSALELRAALEDVDGSLGRIAEERLNTVEGSVKLLKSAWEGLILSLSGSKGPIKWVIDSFTYLLNQVALLSKSFRIMKAAAVINENLQSAYQTGGAEAVAAYIDSQSASLQEQLDNTSWIRFKKRRKLRNAKAALGREAVNFQNQLIEESLGGSPGNSNKGGYSGGSGGGKKKSSWSLSNDEAYLAALAELRKRFNDGQITSQEEYERELYKLEVAALTARLALNIDKGADRAKLEADLQNKITEQRKKDLKAEAELAKEGAAIIASSERNKTRSALLEEDTRFKAEVKKFQETELLYENKTEVIEAIYRKHRNNLLKIQTEAIDRELALEESQHKLEIQKIKREYSENIAKDPLNVGQSAYETKKMNEEIVKADLTYLKKQEEHLSLLVKNGGLNGLKFDEETLTKYLLKLEEVRTKINELLVTDAKNEAGMFGGTGGGTFLGVSQSQWTQLFENLKEGKLKAEDLESALTAIGEAANVGFQMANKAIANTNAKEQKEFQEYQKNQEKEKKALQNRLDSGLVSQEQYNAEVERMEAEAEARQEEMKLKQAKREKSMNIIQSIINTALGVTKTLAQWGFPAGLAPAAIMSAMGAAQTALIAAQPITGKEAGGFIDTRREQDGKRFKARLSPDKRGFISSPTVLVGENGGEYVIPAAGLDNPTLRPILATIESARKAGRLKDLNFEAIYPLSSPIGRESGGYVQSPPPTSTPNVATAANGTLETLAEAISVLNDRLSKPIKADVSMTGRNGIIEKTEEYNRAKKRGQYNG